MDQAAPERRPALNRALRIGGWLVLAVATFVPMLVLAVQSLAIRWFFPDLVPREWTVAALRDVFGTSRSLDAFSTGLVLGALTTAITMAVAVPAARALAFGGIRRPGLAALLVIIPTVIPPIALAMGLSVVAQRAGLVGGLAAVLPAHLAVAIPYAVLVLAGFLTRYDTAFERQALVLGAGPVRVLWRVFLPLAAPGLMVSAALAFVVSWGQYLLTLLPGGGSTVTPTLLLVPAASGGNPTATAALAIVTAIPPALVLLMVVRMLDRPIREGATA